MSIEILSPIPEPPAPRESAAPRPASLEGATVGIISNGKLGTTPFFASLADELMANHGVAAVELERKFNYSAPAGPDIIDRAKQWHAVITGIGD